MILAGGGSGITGLNIMLEDKLADIGECTVHVVDDPVMLVLRWIETIHGSSY